ncbi:hypothetical protein OF83DRAFT_722419 [Amylostereum chailletii]|nr:hypothetical protein OF83DRAFT_722419 [Amylostereum chailletii]
MIPFPSHEVRIAWALARRAALVTILPGNDINQNKINCTLWLAFCYIFSYIAQWLSSALIGIRIIAIWDGSVFVNTFVALMMLGLAGTFLHVIVLAKGDWDFTKPACSILESADNLPNTAGALIVDAVFLFVMLVGLLRRREARLFGLWPLLWKQGIIWLFLAIIAEVPAVTFVALNFNTPMNMMFLAPQVVILLIGATRMYRSLTNFFEPRCCRISYRLHLNLHCESSTAGTNMPSRLALLILIQGIKQLRTSAGRTRGLS